MASSFKKVSRGEINGWIKEELFSLLPRDFFDDHILSTQKSGGELLRGSRLRWAAIFKLPNQQRIFLKRDRTKGWVESLKYLFFPSKARKEWFVAYQLQTRNLSIPTPLGWMERIHLGFVQESYYLSEAIGSGVSLIEEAKRLGDHFPLLKLAKAVKRMHQVGLIHSDLHAGNFIRDGDILYLTDLHGAKIAKRLSLRQRLWNLSLLFHSLKSIWGEEEQSKFMDIYFEGEPFRLRKKEEFLQKVHSWMDRLQKRQWKSRTKRCLKESTEFSIQKEKGTRYYHRRDFPLEVMKGMVEAHLRLKMENPSRLVKLSPKVTVSILEGGGKKMSVKNYHPLKILDRFKEHFRRSKGLKAWIGGNGLRTRGIPSLRPLGLVEKGNYLGLKEGFFLMEVLGGAQELDRFILKNLKDFNERRLFVRAFAQWLSRYHKINLYHKDMKTCNILVSKDLEGYGFYLLDLEDVRLDGKVGQGKLFKNFLQLNTSTPKIVTTTDRFRFFKQYLKFNPIVKDRKSFVRRLVDESKRRELVYVSPEGVVMGKL